MCSAYCCFAAASCIASPIPDPFSSHFPILQLPSSSFTLSSCFFSLSLLSPPYPARSPSLSLCLSPRLYPFPLFNDFRKTSASRLLSLCSTLQSSSLLLLLLLLLLPLDNATIMQILSWKSVDLSLFCKHRHCHCDTTHKQNLSCVYLLCLTLVSLIMHTNNKQSWLFVCLMMHTSNPYTNIEWVHSLMMMHTNNKTQDCCLQWSMHTNN